MSAADQPALLGFFPLLAMAALLNAAPARPADPAGPNMAGTWDLVWQTRSGPSKRGWLVIEQTGSALRAEIHGQGHIKARGLIAGSEFTLKGSRFALPYTIEGRVAGDRIDGSLRVLSVRRIFIGTRRRARR
jgi:hypothetical protein